MTILVIAGSGFVFLNYIPGLIIANLVIKHVQHVQNIKTIVAMAFAASFLLSTVPYSYAQIASVEVDRPTYLDHKYKSDPYICIYSSNPNDLKIAQVAITDWQIHLKDYTKNYNSWNVKIGINEQDRSQCTTEIMYSPYPNTDKFDPADNAWWNQKVTQSKVLGLTYTLWDRAWVYVFTSEYYYPTQTQMVEDSSGKLRAVSNTSVSLSDKQILSVTEHELGHVFGIVQDDDNPTSGSAMSQGLQNAKSAHITSSDVSQVIQKYGTTGFIG
jgi:hypothetical protein